ncbi:pre-mRNA-processing factor 17-like [Watersipora subatra]|uniref:pre-mRNA-processing factor 17-like n=1 Tax=Watersipora subatra TaxID=2589382 RepID=UPI00355B4059
MALASLVSYGGADGSSSGEDEEDSKQQNTEEMLHLQSDVSVFKKLLNTTDLALAPAVATKEDVLSGKPLDPTTKELRYNPKATELYAPTAGPENPFKTQQMKAVKNTITGFAEPSHVSQFQFETQRRTFHSYGYAIDPSADTAVDDGMPIVGDLKAASEGKELTVFETAKLREGDKRKRQRNDDAGDVEGYLGPWGKYIDEKTTMVPDEEEKKVLDELVSKRKKNKKIAEEKVESEEKTTMHLKEEHDYQGRSWMHVPQDVGVSLKEDSIPDKCFIPKRLIHTWAGHTKALSAMRWFPVSAHLLLSCSMDSKIKIWEVYNERRLARTYNGHKQAVRDVNFDNDGKRFLSASYDRMCKLWDTETGQCIGRFTNKKVPYCVKFNPDEDKQDLFVAGTADKKIICFDIRSGEIVQEYDRHLGAVNSITFVDGNRRFVSTSDDKSLRIWEWDIPVDFKYISDPSMHSMPAVTISHNKKWLACQSMDNQVVIFNVLNRMKMMRKKIFKGHMVAGYACGVDFSPDMSYLISGDADGKLYIWDWKSTKLYTKFKAHDDVCISVLWHPHETSKIASAGWDGVIKYWD